jgi:hypothetical protein
MKNLKTLALVTALGLAVCSSAFAQGRPGGTRGQSQPSAQPPFDKRSAGSAAVMHIAEAFPKVAPFDANKDGQLDGVERRALGQAMFDGKVEAPKHQTLPEGVEPPHPGVIIHRIASLYCVAFPFDVDNNGKLNVGEQAALMRAIENGDVQRPGGPRGGRPPGVGGRPF